MVGFSFGQFFCDNIIDMDEKMIIKSGAFKDGDTIPPKYTCDGDNINPLIEIRNVPRGAKSLALVMDDPDATSGGVWDHWIMWSIEPGT
ncbi:MAG: Phosphatidylethanolamine-binding protein, partial [Candidatus Jorgensenbacteria bacterium GW2011_GWA2_45_9]